MPVGLVVGPGSGPQGAVLMPALCCLPSDPGADERPGHHLGPAGAPRRGPARGEAGRGAGPPGRPPGPARAAGEPGGDPAAPG